jgi:hypothetical protein
LSDAWGLSREAFSQFLFQSVCLGVKIAAEQAMIEHKIPVERNDCGVLMLNPLYDLG